VVPEPAPGRGSDTDAMLARACDGLRIAPEELRAELAEDMGDIRAGVLTPKALQITAWTLDLMRPQGGATALQGMQLAEAIQHGKVIGFGSTKRAKDQEIRERLKRALGHRYTPDGPPDLPEKEFVCLGDGQTSEDEK
jgi:hypothetical protein